eukprot:CAMPEP_0118932192 /NCGR_PEP_ID=MMETSP1169-20130426/9447_1 /TAXON_ID=36882 /ORGANISM="Pyramimonas obovata, Strain CCMP722" /LENGTH=107 /DNA_ID=CAMNT_0006874811 /DNA_START=169 /DNA_END=492 /DNA_ORIENTATION=+
MFIRVRSRGGGLTVMLVVPDDSSAYDVLHDPHLVDWPVPDFAEDIPLVVKRATSGERIFLDPELCSTMSPLSKLSACCPQSILELSWSQDGNVHVWVSYPNEGEVKV